MMSDLERKELIRTARRVCFFAHFHQHGIVADYVLYYLRAIRACGFAIVVASTADLSVSEQQKLRDACDHFIPRENKGLDFGGWIEALQFHPVLNAEFLLLTNDSVYGGISDLGQFINELTKEPADFYGAVECDIINAHLQSWFLLFRPAAYNSEAFRDKLGSPVPETLSKDHIVQQYEIGLTHALREQGLSYRAAFRSRERGLLNQRLPYNAGHLLWRQLIENNDIPFLKSDLLRRNLMWVGNMREWRSVVGAKNGTLLKLIEDDLAVRGEASSGTFPARMRLSLGCPFQDQWPELQWFLVRDHDLLPRQRLSLRLNALLFGIVRFVSRVIRKPIRKVITIRTPRTV